MGAVLGQLTLDSSYDDVACAICVEVKARNYTRDEAIGVLADGIQESELQMVWDPSGAWYGYYQQDIGYADRMDPNGNIRGFLDRLDVKRNSPGHGDIWLNIFWLQQRPSEPSAAAAYADGRQGYLTEIKSRTAEATRLVGLYYDTAPGGSVSTPADPNRPDFNEYPVWSPNNQDRAGTAVDLFLLHTQEGGGGNDAAADLANFLADPNSQVSYHYAISLADDGGVTVIDCVDTDNASWSVLDANNRSINLCFAGSYSAWTRQEWIDNAGRAIDVAAYIAAQDAIKYAIPFRTIFPPYGHPGGVSDHRYVTDFLGIGTHTDVGGPMQPPWTGFPWDLFDASFQKYLGLLTAAPAAPAPPADDPTPPPAPADPPAASASQPSDPAFEVMAQTRGRWGKLGKNPDGSNRTLVEALGFLVDKAEGTDNSANAEFSW